MSTVQLASTKETLFEHDHEGFVRLVAMVSDQGLGDSLGSSLFTVAIEKEAEPPGRGQRDALHFHLFDYLLVVREGFDRCHDHISWAAFHELLRFTDGRRNFRRAELLRLRRLGLIQENRTIVLRAGAVSGGSSLTITHSSPSSLRTHLCFHHRRINNRPAAQKVWLSLTATNKFILGLQAAK